MRAQTILLSAVVAVTCDASLWAQSLADVARAEAARRKTVTAPSKVYTNEDLGRGGQGGGAQTPVQPTPATAKPAAAAAKPEPPKQPEARAEEPQKDEKYWKDRITMIQQGLARNTVLLDAMETRINSLRTDALNIDDPAQRRTIQGNLTTAVGENERLKQDIEKQNKELLGIQEEARRANVPPGWLR